MRLFAFIAVLAITLIPTAAFASVQISPREVEAGKTVDLEVTVTASDKPTSRVEIEFTSPSVEQGDVAFLQGWSATLERDDNDYVSSIAWDKGEIAAGQSQTFVVTLTIPATSNRIDMTARQVSPDGTVERFPANGESLSLAVSGATATSTTASVTATTVVPSTQESSTGNGIGFYLIIFGVVVILAVYVRTKRRVKNSR